MDNAKHAVGGHSFDYRDPAAFGAGSDGIADLAKSVAELRVEVILLEVHLAVELYMAEAPVVVRS